ncbi:hypothetical protein K151_2768 [Proteus hauseri ZMd44]|nr:hypothetical protein K151_2768 [Proteus hauseri ZMd44]
MIKPATLMAPPASNNDRVLGTRLIKKISRISGSEKSEAGVISPAPTNRLIIERIAITPIPNDKWNVFIQLLYFF